MPCPLSLELGWRRDVLRYLTRTSDDSRTIGRLPTLYNQARPRVHDLPL